MEKIEYPDLVQITRVGDLEPLICRVWHSTEDCVIASELSDSLDLDGIFIAPTMSIRCFDRDFDKVDFYRAAASAWPSPARYTELLQLLSCNLSQDLPFLAGAELVVAIHMEVDDPDVLYVGLIREVADEFLLIDRISSRGGFIEEPLRIDLQAITKIELLTRYLVAVEHAARLLNQSSSEGQLSSD